MNDLKTIANAMKMATESVLHTKYKHLKGLDKFTCRIGTGYATNVTQKGSAKNHHYVLTYGMKMLISKQTKKEAMQWTTGKEIKDRKYFDGKPSYKNFLVSVILHEYAHAIQFVTEKYESGSIHNDCFYEILDGFYEKNYHVDLDKYLSAFPAYTNSNYLNEDRSLSSVDLIGANYLEFKSKGQKSIVKIVKINRTRVKCLKTNGGIINIPFSMIENVFVNEKDLPNGSFEEKTKLVRKVSPLEKTKEVTQIDIIRGNVKYISILTRGLEETFKIERLNPKNVVGKDVSSGQIYNIPYQLIKNCHTERPSGISEVADIPKPVKKAAKYSKNDLSIDQVIEIKIKNKLTKFEIKKLNPKKFIGKKVNSHETYTIPYNMILKIH